MPNEPYVEEIMVADGDGDHPEVEEVKYETKVNLKIEDDLNDIPDSTDDIEDDDKVITQDDGRWYKKTFAKIWSYIKEKLKVYIGTTTAWSALSDSEKAKYKLLFFTDDENLEDKTAYNIPYNSSNVGTALDTLNTKTAYNIPYNSSNVGSTLDILNDKRIDSSSSDYIKFADGTLIQYGRTKISNDNADVTFTISFNAAPIVSVSESWGTETNQTGEFNNMKVYRISSNGFRTTYAGTPPTKVNTYGYIEWIAIGRWK